MGTVLEIRAEASLADVEAAFREVERLDAVMSDWRADSELSRLNAAAGKGTRRLSPDLARVLSLSGELHEQSRGAFDVTVGPLVLLNRKDPSAPASRRREAFALVAGADLRVDGNTASLRRAGMAVDLGGIGKGYAADRAARVLRERGVRAAFIDFGRSTMLGFGPRPWKIALPDGVVELRDAALGTSESGPSTFDPRTGEPVPPGRRATVRHRSAAAADAWSTALIVLGEAGAGLARKHGADVWLSR